MASRPACPLAPTAETDNCLQCRLCHRYHALRTCPAFKAMRPPQRATVARAQGYCYNCLALTHTTGECDSRGSCKMCGLAHHTLLHNGPKSQRGQGKVPTQQASRKPKPRPKKKKERTPTCACSAQKAHPAFKTAATPKLAKTAKRTIARTPQGLQTAQCQRRNTNRALDTTIRALQELQKVLTGTSLQGGQDV